MDDVDNIPECNPASPELEASKRVLSKLLSIELERLEIAVGIEKARKIVFPETSIIIRDIMKLEGALGKALDAEVDTPGADDGQSGSLLSDILGEDIKLG
tara:strand:+ start:262 stop:561 length:300 start_codon:yes stop_codon:yes gene_type:complete